MAEAVVGVAAASSIFQVIDFSAKVAFLSFNLIKGTEDALRENIEIERLVRDHEALGQAIEDRTPSGKPADVQGQRVYGLANDIKEQSGKVLHLLEGLKVAANATGAKRAWQSVNRTQRALRQRERLQRECNSIQAKNGQLAVAFLQLIDNDQQKQHSVTQDLLETVNQTHVSTVAEILKSRDEICNMLRLRTLETEAEQTRYRARILQALGHKDMFARRDRTVDAYGNTYQWMVTEDTSKLHIWLTRGNSLFWLSGKAGSGKSTLMKSIVQQPETYTALRSWATAETYHLLVAEFYFWYLGTPLQKSVEGLLRSLLTSIIRSCGVAASIAFPPPSSSKGNIGPSSIPDSWTCKHLLNGLQNIADACARDELLHDTGKPYRFCFFIDGLDEYDGDHYELLRIIKSLANNPQIKICVSSREWNPFRTAFEDASTLIRLQDLTKTDITCFVRGQLIESLDEVRSWGTRHQKITCQEINSICDAVVTKAEGVFLWVRLVVQSIREGLLEGDSVASLRRRVEEFPPDLADYFRLIVARIHGRYQSDTASFLLLAHTYVQQGGIPQTNSNFLDYWLLREYADIKHEPHFARKTVMQYCTNADLNEMEKSTQTYLNACCKDLLYLPPSLERPSMLRQSLRKVEFLHRTVYDFLCTDEMQNQLRAQVSSHFASLDTLAQIAAARCKVIVTGNVLLATEAFNEAAEVALTAAIPSSPHEGLDFGAPFTEYAPSTSEPIDSIGESSLPQLVDQVRLKYNQLYARKDDSRGFGLYKEQVIETLVKCGCNIIDRNYIMPNVGGNAHFLLLNIDREIREEYSDESHPIGIERCRVCENEQLTLDDEDRSFVQGLLQRVQICVEECPGRSLPPILHSKFLSTR